MYEWKLRAIAIFEIQTLKRGTQASDARVES